MVGEFNKIYTFMAIVKERSFSKASKVLEISQPAVTLQIKKLEESLQATLIMRKKNGIILTKEGEKFYKLCLKFEDSMFRFKEEANRIKDEKAPIIVATNSLIGGTILPIMLDQICDLLDSDLSIKIADYSHLLSYLLDRRCDFCLMNERIYNDHLIFKQILSYEIVLVSNYKLKKSIDIKDLEKLSYIKDKTKSFLCSYFDQFGVKYDEFHTVYSLDDSVSVKSAILHNKTRQYFAFLPKFMVETEINNGDLFLAHIEKVKITRQLYISGLSENKDMIDKIANLNFNLVC